MTNPDPELARRLADHLTEWLGSWPGPEDRIAVVGCAARGEPTWDGSVRPLVGVLTGSGGVISVPPAAAEAVGLKEISDMDQARAVIPAALGRANGRLFEGVFRWCQALVPGPDVGEWVAVGDERVPEWLRPFNGDVLVAWDEDGRYAAGVGRKQHDRFGHELSVGTEPAHRGRGLARALVAQAARRVYEEGAVATYLHADSNLASAAVAQASGFPDDGWRIVGFG